MYVKKLKSRYSLILVLSLCFLISVGCKSEGKDWQAAKSDNTVEAYNKFIQEHKDSDRVFEARYRIALFKDDRNAYNLLLGRLHLLRHKDRNRGKFGDEEFAEIEYLYAEKINTRKDFEKFLRKYPSSKFTERVRSKLETLSFDEARSMHNILAYKKFLAKYRQSKWSAEARKEIENIKGSWDPRLKDVKTVYIRIEENYRRAPKLKVLDKRWFSEILPMNGLKIAYESTNPTDLELHVMIKGHSLTRNYSLVPSLVFGSTYHSGAVVDGAISLKIRGNTIMSEAFKGRQNPPSSIRSNQYRGPEKAPYKTVLLQKNSFMQTYMNVLGKAFGPPLLASVMQSNRQKFRNQALEAILKLKGRQGYENLKRFLVDPSTSTGLLAIGVIGRFKEPESVPVLLDFLNHSNNLVRRSAVKSLAYFSTAHVKEAVINCLHHDADNQVRGLAVETLAAISQKEAIPHFVKAMIEDPYRMTRDKAAASLTKFGWHTKDPQERVAYLIARRKVVDKKSMPVFISLLQKYDHLFDSTVVTTLAKSNHPQAIHLMLKALRVVKDTWTKRKIIEDLGKLKNPLAAGPLRQMLAEKDFQIRHKSVIILGELKDPKAIQPLIYRLKDSAIGVRKAAHQALVKITGRDFKLNYQRWHTWWKKNKKQEKRGMAKIK